MRGRKLKNQKSQKFRKRYTLEIKILVLGWQK